MGTVSRPSALIVAATLLAVLASARNWAADSNEVNVQFHGFQDTRGVTVLSPTVDLAQDFTERTSLRLNYGVDAISAASDSCVRCHRDGVNSHRQEVGLSVTRKFGDLKMALGGAYSRENFYQATTGSLSASRELAKGNTTVAGGFSFSLNEPMLHPLRDVEKQHQVGGFASVTQTLTRTTIAQASYEVQRLTGYLNNPFLRANVNGVMVLGQVPDLRTRQTLSFRLRQALPGDAYLEADYRRYFDDWQVKSNTVGVGLSYHASQSLLLKAAYRRYDQTGAFFFAPQYTSIPQYYTADFRLEPFASNDVTGRVEWSPKGGGWGLPAGTGLALQYERYRTDNGFEAGIVSTALRVPVKMLGR